MREPSPAMPPLLIKPRQVPEQNNNSLSQWRGSRGNV